MPNPILVELTRGALVESVHRGALAIARPNGEMVVSVGDVKRPVFPRSAVKAFQCLPLVESGQRTPSASATARSRSPAPRTAARRHMPSWPRRCSHALT